jgi:hypothetical protein
MTTADRARRLWAERDAQRRHTAADEVLDALDSQPELRAAIERLSRSMGDQPTDDDTAGHDRDHP